MQHGMPSGSYVSFLWRIKMLTRNIIELNAQISIAMSNNQRVLIGIHKFTKEMNIFARHCRF